MPQLLRARVLSSVRARIEIVGLTLVLLLCAAVGLAVVPAVAGGEKLEGTPVPEADIPALVAGALSCPALNPPRLAAQVMAVSEFSDAGPNGNLAGMDAATWKKWRPNTEAKPSDRAAAIVALAHRTCATVGRLRASGQHEDLWVAALADHGSGDAAAKKKYGEDVLAYSRWYADQPAFAVAANELGNLVVQPYELSVPEELVAPVQAAGKVCALITPARVAAQLRALSKFEANKRSSDGRLGVAQFTPEMWTTYAKPGASIWEPEDAIPALGAAMCALTTELKSLSGGGDPYRLALGAYQWGPKVIRQADGLPRTTVPQLADAATAYVAEYQRDSRLTTPARPETATPKPSASAPSTAGKPSAGTPATPPAAPTKPATPRSDLPPVKAADRGGVTSYGPYLLYNQLTGMCADLDGIGAGAAGQAILQDTCVKDAEDNQEFIFTPRGADASGNQLYWIRNADDGLCVDVYGYDKVVERAAVLEAECLAEDNQEYRLEPRGSSGGRQYFWIVNDINDMCFEVFGNQGDRGHGTQLSLVPCATGDDHEWALVRKNAL
jgi:hypothetical protein